jgi:hypothetical protein
LQKSSSTLPAVAVRHQAARDGGERPRFADLRRHAIRQHADEGILRQIRRLARIAQLMPQPALQPAVMAAVECVQVLLLGKIGGRHGILSGLACARECK